MQKENIEFSRDGLTIRGHVWGRRDVPQHAVILSHGFLANEKMCFRYAELLAELGFLAVTYDFCGGGIRCRSDGRTQDMTVLTEKADLQAVLAGVRERFAPSAVSLLGCSQGGFVSGLAAAELGAGEIAGLMLFYPAVCIPDDARSGKMMFYRFDPEHIPDLLGGFPMKLGGDYARTVIGMDPYKEMRGYDGPVLLLHGTEDRIVKLRYARVLKDVYPGCRYEEIPGAGHIFRGRYDERACAVLREFAQELLGEGGSGRAGRRKGE